MTKQQFLDELAHALRDLPHEDVRDSTDYYREMIDDRMESGMSEEEAVADLGSPAAVAREILLHTPLPTLLKSKHKKKKPWRAWEIVLLAVGSPIWLPLAASVLIVVLSVYIMLWSVVISLWAVDASLLGFAVYGFAMFGYMLASSPATALLHLGLGLFSAGGAILGFFGCLQLTRIFVKISVWILKALKKLIIGKESCI